MNNQYPVAQAIFLIIGTIIIGCMLWGLIDAIRYGDHPPSPYDKDSK